MRGFHDVYHRHSATPSSFTVNDRARRLSKFACVHSGYRRRQNLDKVLPQEMLLKMTVKELFNQTKSMKPLEKATLVDLILAELDKPDAEVEGAWLIEIQRRKLNLKTGRTKALSYQVVMGKYK